MSDITEKFWRAPPVTRTLVAAMFIESGLVISGLLPFRWVLYYNPWIFKFPPELWRLMTSFLVTGGGLSFIFDLYFTWTYGSGLELNSPRFSEPGSFFVYVCFIASVIWSLIAEAVPGFEEDYPCGTHGSIIRISINGSVCGIGMVTVCRESFTRYNNLRTTFDGSLHYTFDANLFQNPSHHSGSGTDSAQATSGLLLGSMVFTSSLLLAFVYTFAQDNRGKKGHFIIFQIPVELLPWAMLTLTLVMSGPGAALDQATGILAAHLYDFMTRLYPTFQGGRNLIRTPLAIRRYFGAEQVRITNKAYGTSIRPGQPTAQTPSSSSGWTSGFSSSWGGRGAGRRLGGD